MKQYAYSPIAYQIGTQITGRSTQAIQNRFAKVDQGVIEEVKYEAEQLDGGFGEYWEKLTQAKRLNSFQREILDTLHYIVGDSW